MRPILVLTVLVLNLWALVDLAGRRTPLVGKLGWGLVIVALPLVGALGWLVRRAGHPQGVHAVAGMQT